MHRIILEWKLNDLIPDGLVVDHINQDKLDNRRENLRLATRSLNAFNSKIQSNNSSGFKGVDFHNTRKEYRARIGSKHLGWFSTIEEAVEARQKAEEELLDN